MPIHPYLEPYPVHGFRAVDWPRLNEGLDSLYLQLEDQIAHPLPAAMFNETGDGPAGVWNNLRRRGHAGILESSRRDKDLPGVYIFVALLGDAPRPFYVGITRSLCKRLRQHLRGETHNTASLLYAMLRGEAVSEVDKPKKQRKDVSMTDKTAQQARAWLNMQHVALMPLSCPVERYALELLAAIRFQTGKFNAFETH